MPPKKSRGLVVLLFSIALMAVFGAGTLSYVFYFNSAEKTVVDPETHSIIITHKSATSTHTERILFDNVERIENVMGGKRAMFEIVAVTTDGSRYVIKLSDDKPLNGHAEHIAAVIDKPLVQVRNIKTFGD